MRRRRWLVLITGLVGVLAAITVTVGTPSAERTFAATSGPVQSLMSITVPFFGVLLVTDLLANRRDPRLAPTLRAAVLLAVGFAVFGIVVAAAAVAVFGSDAPGGRWEHAGAVVVGSVVVQVVAQLTGTGLGLLLRRIVLACLATIVLPLGLWALLGAADVLRPLQPWLTPFGSVPHLLAGDMTPLRWVQELVVVLLWAVGLNVAGARSRP